MKPEYLQIKVVISGGGTGGHVYPAIAIADAIREIHPEANILFVGAEGKMEMEKVPLAGYPILGLPIAGLQRKFTFKNLLLPFKLWESIGKARKILSEFNPEVVVGVGGYASGPVLRAAAGRKIPILIQEQNGYAGLTNKWLSAKAKVVCVAYPGMEKFFPAKKIKLTGNPVRKDIGQNPEKLAEAYGFFDLDPRRKILMLTGGSLGSATLNESLAAGLTRVLEAGHQVIWGTGKWYYDTYARQFGHLTREGLRIYPFINRMDLAYQCAQVVISRSGALSVSELCLAGKPAILVPSPNVAEDHQTKNAMALVNEGAALLVKDQNARNELVEAALALLADQARQQQLQEAILKLAKPEAANDIAREVLALSKTYQQLNSQNSKKSAN
jgi:UDP-N-acetylglucosamine--N-acetylmuramyl-(pentapeptide) pyrophosphoryl-undecaprenol N-acetylglucosamine transferase